MDDRVREIVFFIVDSMVSTTDENIINEIQDLSEMLIDQGYTESEINSAFTWLMENISESDEAKTGRSDQNLTSIKSGKWPNILNTTQSQKALDFLYQLKELDIVGEDEIEQILDQSLMQGKHGTSISEIKARINGLIFNPTGVNAGSFFVYNQKYHGH